MASEADNAILNATIEVNLAKLQKQLDKANQIIAGNTKGMERSFQSSSRKIQSEMDGAATVYSRSLKRMKAETSEFQKTLLVSFGAGFAGGMVAEIFKGLPSALTSAVKSIADLKNEAAKAVVAVEVFQELSYAAEQSGVTFDGLTDGLKELQLRADEFIVTGKGSAAESLTRLGYSVDDLKGKLHDPAALFDEIIQKVRTLDKAAQIRILDELFGGTGAEEFQKFLTDGARGLGELRDEARATGRVFDEDMVRKAVELDRAFNQVANTVSATLKRAIVCVAGEVADLVDLTKSLGERSASSIATEISEIETAIQRWTANGLPAGNLLDNWNVRLAELRAELARQETAATSTGTGTVITIGANRLSGLDADFAAKLKQMIADAAAEGIELGVTSGFRSSEKQAEIWAAALEKYGSPAAARKHAAPPGGSMHEKGLAADISFSSQAAREWAAKNAGAYGLGFPVPSETPLGGPDAGHSHAHIEPVGARGGSSRDAETEAAQRQAAAIAKVTAAIQFESDQLGRTELAQEIALRQREAGVTSSSAAGQAIAAETSALWAKKTALEATKAAEEGYNAKLKETAERSRATSEEMNGALKGAIGGFLSDLRNGTSLADAFKNALDRVIDSMITMTLNAAFALPTTSADGTAATSGGIFSGFGGLLSGIFGGLFGFEKGGYTGAGHRLKPAGIVHAGEYVFPADSVKRLGVANLERIRRMPGFEAGGFVGASSTRTPSLGSGRSAGTSSSVTIAPSISVKVEGGSRGETADASLAKQIGREVEGTIRGLVIKEMLMQKRPGGVLAGAR